MRKHEKDAVEGNRETGRYNNDNDQFVQLKRPRDAESTARLKQWGSMREINIET